MGSSLAEQLERAERQTVADLFVAANGLAGISAVIDDPATHRPSDVADSARDLRTRAARAHRNLIELTATHSPVASDLRLVFALIEIAHHCTLVSNQFDLISEQLAALNPMTIDRSQSSQKLTKMAAIASVQLRKATDVFRARDLAAAQQLDVDDDQLDLLNRDISDTVARLETAAEERDLGFRYVLIARSLERIGDNAVDIGEQTAFLITARHTEFSDASQPRHRADDK
ncbi:MAG: PhoU domain-containing protein [Solirubrobacteraceae bacterium]